MKKNNYKKPVVRVMQLIETTSLLAGSDISIPIGGGSASGPANSKRHSVFDDGTEAGGNSIWE